MRPIGSAQPARRIAALTVWLHNGDASWSTAGAPGCGAVPAARAVVVARVPDGVPAGRSTLLVAGADQRRGMRRRRARSPPTRPPCGTTYAVAMDGTGHVLAAGRPAVKPLGAAA